MLKQIENKIFSFNFQCVRCGNCCTRLEKGVPLFYKDAKKIALFKNLHLNDFLLQYCELNLHETIVNGHDLRIAGLYLKTSDHTCIFYKNNGCSIHKAKPYYCKSSPFISLLFQDNKTIEAFKKYCKGFGHGNYYNKKKIKSILKREIELEEKEWQLYHSGLYNSLVKLFKIGGRNDTEPRTKS